MFEGIVSGLKDSLTAGYQWRRLWVPREGFLDLSDHGFPHLPDDERRQLGAWKHDAVYFDAIANTPCLILLGEPGMGKTHALREERRAVETRSGSNESKTLFLDLRSYSSEDRLIRDLFENPSFLGWIRGEHGLHVMLDSLDECLLRIDTVATLLGEKFQELPSVFGLSLRIACRTAEWSPGLERALRSKWGDSAFGVFEIVPLTRPDVIEAADANALDSRRFLEEVEKREVVPLAFKPVTLEFLLKSFRENRQLPASQHELYARGCRLLCAETNESRAYSALRGRLTPEQRLAVAGRMAAATIFCNRNAIWRADTPPPEGDITIDELCGERTSNGISRDDVLETLDTGLFSSRGIDRMGWAHQTYAEFLAARFVVEQGMPAEQIFNLLMHRGTGGFKLVPQLHEAAAWLATMNRDVFAAVMKSDFFKINALRSNAGLRETTTDMSHDLEDNAHPRCFIGKSLPDRNHHGIGKFRLFGRRLPFDLRLSQGVAFAIFAVDGLIQDEREKFQLQARRVVHRGGLSPIHIVLSVFIPNLARVLKIAKIEPLADRFPSGHHPFMSARTPVVARHIFRNPRRASLAIEKSELGRTRLRSLWQTLKSSPYSNLTIFTAIPKGGRGTLQRPD